MTHVYIFLCTIVLALGKRQGDINLRTWENKRVRYVINGKNLGSDSSGVGMKIQGSFFGPETHDVLIQDRYVHPGT